MGQLVNVLLAVNKANIVPQRDLDYGSGVGGLNHIYGPNRPTPPCNWDMSSSGPSPSFTY